MFISPADTPFDIASRAAAIERRYRRRWFFATHLALYMFAALLLALENRVGVALVWMPVLLMHTLDHVFYELRERALDAMIKQEVRAFFTDTSNERRSTPAVEFYDQQGRRVDAAQFFVRPLDLLPPPR